MKIAYIVGSPKPGNSASEYLLKGLADRCGSAHEPVWLRAGKDAARDAQALEGCGALAFAFPLYVDGIPSHLLRWLLEAEPLMKAVCPEAKVYVLVNCGFFEARQTRHALAMMRIWCGRSGLTWGCAPGRGGGGMAMAAPLGHGPGKSFGLALDAMARQIAAKDSAEDRFAQPNFPRPLYIAAAHMGWKRTGRKNGLKKAELYRQLPPYPERED